MMTLPTSTSSIITYLTNASILTSSDDEGSKENDATKRVSSNKQKYSTTLNAMQGLIMKSTIDQNLRNSQGPWQSLVDL